MWGGHHLLWRRDVAVMRSATVARATAALRPPFNDKDRMLYLLLYRAMNFMRSTCSATSPTGRRGDRVIDQLCFRSLTIAWLKAKQATASHTRRRTAEAISSAKRARRRWVPHLVGSDDLDLNRTDLKCMSGWRCWCELRRSAWPTITVLTAARIVERARPLLLEIVTAAAACIVSPLISLSRSRTRRCRFSKRALTSGGCARRVTVIVGASNGQPYRRIRRAGDRADVIAAGCFAALYGRHLPSRRICNLHPFPSR